MKGKINSYLAALLVTVAGAGAAVLIVHLTFSETLPAVLAGNQAEYLELQQSILANKPLAN